MLKKIQIVLIFLLVLVPLFAKPKNMPEPDWFRNYRKIYPNNTYLAQRGSGKSEKEAQTDAVAQIARYIKSTVNANLTTSMTAIQKGDKVQEETRVINETEISSYIELSGIEYTESYYYKGDKTWYCVAFINREDAWIQYKPEIDSKKAVFYGFYDKAKKEEEPIEKCQFYNAALKSSEEFLKKLEFGRLLNPTREAQYKSDRNTISEIPSLIEKEAQNIKVDFSVSGDYGKIIENAVSSAFKDAGFKTGEKGYYSAKIEIDNAVSGNDPLSITPSVKVELLGNSKKSVYSYIFKSQEKTVSYALETAQKKAFPKIAEKINEEIKSDLKKQFGL